MKELANPVMKGGLKIPGETQSLASKVAGVTIEPISHPNPDAREMISSPKP